MGLVSRLRGFSTQACLASLLVLSALLGSTLGDTKLEETLKRIRKKHNVPALACGVVVDGKLVNYAAVGFRKSGADIRVTREDKFHLGSCTKSMTATLIGILVDRGKLQWNSTVGDTLPMLADSLHADFREVTVDHLMMHRAGLPNASYTGVNVSSLPQGPRAQRLEYVRQVLRNKPQYAIGAKMVYANAGYSVLGVMAETVTNKSWEDLMREHIFAPLKMTSAGFGAMGAADKLDQPWQHRSLAGLLLPVAPGPRADNLDAIGPGGKVHCSIADWSKFIGVHLQQGRSPKPFLSPETWKHLHSPKFGGDYAGGWVVKEQYWSDDPVLFHNGSNTMNFCTVWFSPQGKFAVLQATNCGRPLGELACNDVTSAMIERYLPHKKAAQPPRGKEDKALSQLAAKWFRMAQNEKLPPKQLNAGLRQFFSTPQGAQFCRTLNALGEPKSFKFQSTRRQASLTIHVYKLEFATSVWRWEIGFDKNGVAQWLKAVTPF